MKCEGDQIRICFIAPTGFGKTTAANLMAGMEDSISNIKLAQPLYDLQNQFYQLLGIDIRGKQDGEFLQFMGHKIQRESPDFLADRFEEHLDQNDTSLVTNDDCRPHNISRLKALGFICVRIRGFCRNRDDHRRLDPAHPVEAGIEEIECEYELDNFATMSIYQNDVRALLAEIRRNLGNEKKPS